MGEEVQLRALGRVKPWSRGASDAPSAPELPAFKRSLLRLMAAAEAPTCARQCSSTASSRASGASALRALGYMSGPGALQACVQALKEVLAPTVSCSNTALRHSLH